MCVLVCDNCIYKFSSRPKLVAVWKIGYLKFMVFQVYLYKKSYLTVIVIQNRGGLKIYDQYSMHREKSDLFVQIWNLKKHEV